MMISLASIPLPNVETKITICSVAPRNSDYIGAKQPMLILPGIGTELRVIDIYTAFLSSTTMKSAPKSIN
jgi:hypothetical protein